MSKNCDGTICFQIKVLSRYERQENRDYRGLENKQLKQYTMSDHGPWPYCHQEEMIVNRNAKQSSSRKKYMIDNPCHLCQKVQEKRKVKERKALQNGKSARWYRF